MRISFDLDDTLICYRDDVPREPALPWYLRYWAGKEPLRLGARALMRDLIARGWEVWIYTTSHRSPDLIRRWLLCHGVHVAGIINQDIHRAHFERSPQDRPPTKNPGAFGIALHVDDSEWVQKEGLLNGFNVIVVKPDDTDWAEKVLLAADTQ